MTCSKRLQIFCCGRIANCSTRPCGFVMLYSKTFVMKSIYHRLKFAHDLYGGISVIEVFVDAIWLPSAKVGVARLNRPPEKGWGEKIEEAKEERIDWPPFYVFVELVEHDVHVVCGDEEQGGYQHGHDSVPWMLVRVRILVRQHCHLPAHTHCLYPWHARHAIYISRSKSPCK